MANTSNAHTIYLVDYRTAGHHGNYVTLFSQILQEFGCHVVLLFPEKLESFNQFHSESFVHVPIDKPSNKGCRFQGIHRWRSAYNDIKKANQVSGRSPDLVYFMFADEFRLPQDRFLINWGYKLFIERIFKWSWTGLYFHPTHYRMSQKQRQVLDRVFSFKNCQGVNVLDEGVIDAMSEYTGNEVYFIPDITYEEEVLTDFDLQHNINTFAAGRLVVSCVGAIQHRKGVLELLKIFGSNDDVLVVIGGKLMVDSFSSEEFNEYQNLKAVSNNLMVVERYLTHKEINTIYQESDFLWAAYVNFPHSSGVMTMAARMRKPVIVNRGFLMEERVKRYNTGLVIDTGDVETARDVFHKNSQKVWDDSAFEKFKNDFSIEEFKNTFQKYINSKVK
jgi:glycosyltransferase involved in cell wall biosynthesis